MTFREEKLGSGPLGGELVREDGLRILGFGFVRF